MRIVGNRRDDQGYALLYVIGLASVLSLLLTTLAVVSVRESQRSGRYRLREATLAVAEGQVDAMTAQVAKAVADANAASAAPAWPCTTAATTVTDSGPTPISASTTVVYSDAGGAAYASCPSGTAVVAGAVVRSVVTAAAVGTQVVRRVVEEQMTISGGGGGGTTGVSYAALPRAVFADKAIVLTNTVTVARATGGPSPSVYSSSGLTCNNAGTFAGDVVVQGDLTLGNGCTVGGTATTNGRLYMTGSTAKVTGAAYATGSASINGGAGAVASVQSGSTITWSQCSASPSLCKANTPPAQPAAEPLPSLPWNAAVESTWRSNGWDVVKYEQSTDCSVNSTAVWLQNTGTTAGTKTVIHTTCQVSLQNLTIALARDVAIVADGGVQDNGTAFRSSSPRSLYLIEPTGDGTSNNGISLNNGATFDPTISTLVFTPGFVGSNGALTLTGQVYAGTSGLNWSNSVSLTYSPLFVPVSSGSSGSSTSGSTATPYTLRVTSKQEAQ